MRRSIFATVVCIAAGMLYVFAFLPSAQSQKGPESRWILDDVQKGVAEGKRTGKPLMVVFR